MSGHGHTVCSSTDLSFLHCHRLTAGRDLLINAGEEVLGNAEGILQEGVIWMTGWGVLQQVLKHTDLSNIAKHSIY